MRGHLTAGGVVALVIASLVTAAPALGASVYTVSGTSDPPTSACSGTVCPSLRDAVMAANGDPFSTVQLGSGTYTLSQGSLQLLASMTITGEGSSATTIEQTAADRVIFSNGGTSIAISGVTITGGHLTGASATSPTAVFGAGVLNEGTMTLTGDAITNNVLAGGNAVGASSGLTGGSAFGSAIASGAQTAAQSSLTLVNTSVTGNVVQGGEGGSATATTAGTGGEAWGAIYGDSSSTIVIRNATVSGNQSTGGQGGTAATSSNSPGFGGSARGAVSSDGALSIVDSTITGNTTTGGIGGTAFTSGVNAGLGGDAVGGGVTGLGTVTITGSTITNNSAVGGTGGLAVFGPGDGGPGGQGDGGGMEVGTANAIVNTTISGNTATAGIGGAGNLPGMDGTGAGGGLYAGGAINLASVTLAGNSATGSRTFGGNLMGDNGGMVNVADTIIAAGSAGHGSNCYGVSETDNGHNLEDTTPSQCGLSSVSDQVGANAGLAVLAANGGPTQTRALVAGSRALGTGGACTDPSQIGSPALTVDQRGLPRPTGACDIGAYQFQAPAGTGPPEIAGAPSVGRSFSCSQGSWTGDQLTFSYQWLRDGAPIGGATSTTYTVASADAGHQLACQVTGSNAKGAVSQTSSPVSIPSPSAGTTTSGVATGTSGGPNSGGSGPPVITLVRETNKLWVRGRALARISSERKHPIGTVFSFTLNQTASVRFTFLLAATGRKLGKACVTQTKRNRTKPGCTRLLPAGTLAFAGHPGTNEVAFQGRLSRKKTLKLGTYTLLITATNSAGQTSSPQALQFTVVNR